jgi:serine/threonine-protein kinase
MPIRPGVVLGHYRLEQRIGAGGMAEVWRALDENLHRTVAVKIMGESIARDTAFSDRFLREARLVAGLDDQNILPVYAFGTEEIDGRSVSYLVMKLVDGGSLKERITGAIPPQQAVTWLQAIGHALDHAHEKGILHRDVKPANVLLDSAGRPLLADFGLARSADSVSGLTATGTVLGTPMYMAPEQAMGKDLDGRADQYALAVIAFELLVGRVPFKADTPLGVLHQHVSTPPEPVSQVGKGLPPEADVVMARALAKSPAERYASCQAFVEALAISLGCSLPGMPAASAPAHTRPFAPAAPGAPPPVPTAGTSEQRTVISHPDVTPLPPAVPARPSAPPPVPGAGRGEGVLAAPASVPGLPPKKASALPLVLAIVGAFVAVCAGTWFVLHRGKETATKTAASLALPAATPETPATPATSATVPTPATGPADATPPVPATSATSGTVAAPETAPASESATVPPAASGDGNARPGRPPGKGGSAYPEGGRSGSAAGGGASQDARPARPVRKEPLLYGPSFSSDTTLSAGFAALDSTRRRAGRLERSDFAEAMGEAGRARQSGGSGAAEFLYTFSRAGSAFAGGDENTAWALLRELFGRGGPAPGRTLVFVKELVQSHGARPGVDGAWIMGLAFGDVRGDLDEELERAAGRSPGNGAVTYARALNALRQGNPQAHPLMAEACQEGVNEACTR